MKRIICLALASVTLQGCTSSITPVGFPGITAQSPFETCADPTGNTRLLRAKTRVEWYTCALRNKARANFNQSQAWENRTEWRDIPLMTAAATVAGLLLFGERDGAGALKPGEQDVIEGTAFGAAAFASFANYLSPETARRLLRQGARGHFCMANQGELLISVWDDVASRSNTAASLVTDLATLDSELSSADPSLPNIAEIREIRDAGYRAVELYQRQWQSLNSADVFLSESAWDFGLDLVAQKDRAPIDTAAFARSISDQAKNLAEFEQAEEDTGTPVETALVSAGQAQVLAISALQTKKGSNTIYSAAQTVASRKAKLMGGLANVEGLISGFDTCASNALVGGDPRAARVQRILPH